MSKDAKQKQVINKMADLFNKIGAYNKPIMAKTFPELTYSEIETIELIANIPNANVTKIAEKCYMTRGAISKMTKKMQAKDLIETYKNDDNKKEIYFRLTKKGKEIDNKHHQLHDDFYERDKKTFNNMSDENLDSMLNFLDAYNIHMDHLKNNL